jgi:hypothetical protein
MCMQTKKGTAPQALTDASDFAGQLDLLVQMAAAHGRGTPEYIVSCIQFALKIGKAYVDFLLHVHRQRHCAPARAQPPDEAA